MWSPNPPASFDQKRRIAYFAGYSDGWYGYKIGCGGQATDAYLVGFTDGRSARNCAKELNK